MLSQPGGWQCHQRSFGYTCSDSRKSAVEPGYHQRPCIILPRRKAGVRSKHQRSCHVFACRCRKMSFGFPMEAFCPCACIQLPATWDIKPKPWLLSWLSCRVLTYAVHAVPSKGFSTEAPCLISGRAKPFHEAPTGKSHLQLLRSRRNVQVLSFTSPRLAMIQKLHVSHRFWGKFCPSYQRAASEARCRHL